MESVLEPRSPARLSLIVVGWREWLALPEFGVAPIKAKVDTGARTTALHVEWQEQFEAAGVERVRFALKLGSSDAPDERIVDAPIADRRQVTDSGGRRELRVFINTTVALAGQRWAIETNLTQRHGMLFPMLLGRTAMAGRLIVDPQRSFVLGQPAAAVVEPRR